MDPELQAYVFDSVHPQPTPQHLVGLRSSDMRSIRGTDDRGTLRILEWISREAKRPRGSTRWADVFVARMYQLKCQLVRIMDLDLANVVTAIQYQYHG
ncbi:unnamed protein product [Strongylus vulgaris]|uniref:Uncharacterized protein n=1 Tax=Strongylus vulgaris TaxID=40348 RepID=A0A3P7J401_STRVU|nr:unnamed protein product [Strongylus vulgaris]